MKTYNVVVSFSERRDYLVKANSKEEAEENWCDFEYTNSTPLEEYVVEVEEIK
jgi:hypothetical protein|tara:strand:+ start:200 stop:358 length:159 start_codon:yes stop_codon:yes gene_type:complete